MRGIVPLLVFLILVAGLVVFFGLGASLKSASAGASRAGSVVRYGVSNCIVGNISISVFAVYNSGELDVFYTVTPQNACYSVVHIGVKPLRLSDETVLNMTIRYSVSRGPFCGQTLVSPMSGTYSVFPNTPPRKITVIVTSINQLNEATSTRCLLVPSG